MKRKLLVICGPTATGKTSLALHLAHVFNGELVSADSRQVYRGMDIGTGKDLPKNSKTQKLQNSKLPEFYEIEGVKIWGYDLVEAKKEFSVSGYTKIAGKILEDIWSRGKLPILVGGTGFYIRSVVDGIATVSIPRNKDLRKSLEGKSANELFEILAVDDPIKAAAMNLSDRGNPRRLVRAIEIANNQSKFKSKSKNLMRRYKTLFIGLNTTKKVLDIRIEKRVRERVRLGIKKEIRNLLKQGVRWDSQAMQALGYRQWRAYFESEKGKDEVVKDWINKEKKYLRRQVIWFKKDRRINWFDITKKNWGKDVEKLVRKWYI